MAWPGNRRERRASRGGALGYEHRGVGLAPSGLDPWGRPWDLQSEGRWNLENPPLRDLDTPLTNCGPEQRYNMQASVPGCPEPPGRLMFMGDTINIPAGETRTFTFDSPGIFCPQRLLIVSDDVELLYITKISTGTRNQLLSGRVPALIYSIQNVCCPPSCLDCMCAPGVQLTIEILNTDVTDEDVTVSLIGVYYDIPAGMTAREALATVKTSFPGCPVPGRDKLVGFTTGPMGIVTTMDIEIETPGRFCPRQLFFFTDFQTQIGDVDINSIRTATDENIIQGPIPASFWSIENECCVLTCLPCLCMPGVPMIINVTVPPPGEGINRHVDGVILGDYEDVC